MTADIHIHSKPYQDSLVYGKQLLNDLLRLSQQHKVAGLIIIGDLWHQKHATPVNVLLTIANWLDDMKKANIPVHWVRGNHESQLRSDPQQSLIQLYGEKCCVYTDNYRYNIGHATLYFVAWYPTDVIKTKLAEHHQIAIKNQNKKNILFAHCGIREGHVSEEGFQIPQDLSIKDLLPELYDLILLGDYHGHQRITDKVFYVGEPIPTSFNSFSVKGPWLLEITDRVTCESLALPSRYPQFITHTVTSPDDLKVILDPFNRNRVFCTVDMLTRVNHRYPFAAAYPIDTQPLADRSLQPSLKSHQQILKEYIFKKFPKDKSMYETARRYLDEVEKSSGT